MRHQKKEIYVGLGRLIVFLFFVQFILIVSFLVRWQFLETNDFVGLAAERYKEKSIRSIRGDIQASDGTTLAFSEPRYDVFAYLKDIEEAEVPAGSRGVLQTREEFVSKVAAVLKKDEDTIAKTLASGPVWVKIASEVSYGRKKKLEDIRTDKNENRRLVGLNYEFTSRRIYPEGSLASHIIGFLGKDLHSNDIGRNGLEQLYDGVLQPQEGYTASETDKFGNIISLSDSVSIDAKRGSSVVTTINKELQKLAERKIREGVETYNAESGSIIIMDPKTGEILSLANYPTYSPSKYYEVENAADFGNKAINIPYEVGSVAKVFTMAAAVEVLDMSPDDVVLHGHKGCSMIYASKDNKRDKREVCTHDKKPKSEITAIDAMVTSDNLAFVELADNLQKENMHKYLSAFGVGSSSGIDLSGESFGFLPKLDKKGAWHNIDMAVFSFGHGYQMNLMQVVRGVGVIPNKGFLVRPFTVSKIIGVDGEGKEFRPIIDKKVVSEETAAEVSYMMQQVFKDHIRGGFEHLAGYKIGSKSGTALIPNKNKAGYSSEINATYVGFDAGNNSKFIMAIRLEAPKSTEKLSYYSARPLWLSTFGELKDIMGLKKQV